ncbi:hypothetical protein BGX31_002455 [Mortierella sp. GBA43]|nr:hypothetical protein BGX31_002455 [Mortierella sp. GBA43]
MSRRRDPIAEQAPRLCQYMNDQPAVVLLYARYFGEYPNASNARMTAIDQDGFDVSCQDGDDHRDIRVAFNRPIRSLSHVREELMTLATEARTALHGKGAPSQGFETSLDASDSDPLAGILLTAAYVAVYLDLFPNTTNPVLQWILQTVGSNVIHAIVLLATGLHVLEAFVSLYYTLVLGSDHYSAADSLQWFASILLLGYPMLFKLVALTNSQTQRK